MIVDVFSAGESLLVLLSSLTALIHSEGVLILKELTDATVADIGTISEFSDGLAIDRVGDREDDCNGLIVLD